MGNKTPGAPPSRGTPPSRGEMDISELDSAGPMTRAELGDGGAGASADKDVEMDGTAVPRKRAIEQRERDAQAHDQFLRARGGGGDTPGRRNPKRDHEQAEMTPKSGRSARTKIDPPEMMKF